MVAKATSEGEIPGRAEVSGFTRPGSSLGSVAVSKRYCTEFCMGTLHCRAQGVQRSRPSEHSASRAVTLAENSGAENVGNMRSYLLMLCKLLDKRQGVTRKRPIRRRRAKADAVTRIRTGVAAATTQSTSHYTIVAAHA
ncbi:hypothetical protein KOW79_007881 [Hemibagrus wyckioides]|uniref:Uncharacterized protein n=1 Tax=Hemibagrus wyckioides TaxID=337641 RepID=A0A9D3SL09_9TELE|nr:hypothetical protein KOW79_007881 [Hemibagrus wyckioides]